MKQAVDQINSFPLDVQLDLQKLPTTAHSILSSSFHLSLPPLSLLSSFSYPPSPLPKSLHFILSAHYNLIRILVLPGTLNCNYSAGFLLADKTSIPGPLRESKQN